MPSASADHIDQLQNANSADRTQEIAQTSATVTRNENSASLRDISAEIDQIQTKIGQNARGDSPTLPVICETTPFTAVGCLHERFNPHESLNGEVLSSANVQANANDHLKAVAPNAEKGLKSQIFNEWATGTKSRRENEKEAVTWNPCRPFGIIEGED